MNLAIHFFLTAMSLFGGVDDSSYLTQQNIDDFMVWMNTNLEYDTAESTSGTVYVPQSMNLIRGANLTGSVEDLQSSDDQRVTVERGFTLNSCDPDESRINLELNATLSTDQPTSLIFTVESQISSLGISQWISVRDWTRSPTDDGILFFYDTCGAGTETGSWQIDGSMTIDLTDVISRVVEQGTGRVQASVHYHQISFQTSFPEVAGIDHVFWEASE